MIHILLHKTLAAGLALLVLISTVSFTINTHYCGDTLVDTAIFKEAKACGMEIQSTTTSSECSIMKKNCCIDEQIIVEGQDELKLSNGSLNFEHQLFVVSFYYTYLDLFEGLESNVIPFKGYPPPLIVKNIQQLDEVYLI